PSERDQNFRIGDFVLKIANPGESREFVELQSEVLALLSNARTGLAWPRVIASSDFDGHIVRLLTWIPGRCMAEHKPYSAGLLRSLATALAAMDNALAGFDRPAAHRTFHWDMRQAEQARTFLPLIEPDRQQLVRPVFDRWSRIDWSALPHSLIHGDAND